MKLGQPRAVWIGIGFRKAGTTSFFRWLNSGQGNNYDQKEPPMGSDLRKRIKLGQPFFLPELIFSPVLLSKLTAGRPLVAIAMVRDHLDRLVSDYVHGLTRGHIGLSEKPLEVFKEAEEGSGRPWVSNMIRSSFYADNILTAAEILAPNPLLLASPRLLNREADRRKMVEKIFCAGGIASLEPHAERPFSFANGGVDFLERDPSRAEAYRRRAFEVRSVATKLYGAAFEADRRRTNKIAKNSELLNRQR